MNEIVPLQVYPWPMDEDQLGVLKEAKASLDLDFRIMPTRAVPGLHARVLGLGSKPPWFCDCAVSVEPKQLVSLTGALRWVLTAPESSNDGYMVMDYMKSVFGDGVMERDPDPCHCGRPPLVKDAKLHAVCVACAREGCELVGWCMIDD